MNVYTDEISGLQYVDFEDVLDDNIELDDTTKLIINGILRDYIYSLTSKFMILYEVIISLKDDYLTDDEATVYKSKFKDLYYNLRYEYESEKEHDGYWKYINNCSIQSIYNYAVGNNPRLQLSEIFEDKDFAKNIIQNTRGAIL